MRCAAIIPTRDRPDQLRRAVTTFYAAVAGRNLEIARVVVADDSRTPTSTANVVHSLAAEMPNLAIEYLRPEMADRGCRGPGATRNRGLRHIALSGIPHDCVVMFDDDISFGNCIYQDTLVASSGAALFDDIADDNSKAKVIVGTKYVGRQDLSLLDHISLLAAQEPIFARASTERGPVPLEAPGGISGAFLFATMPSVELPEFLPWYNEDYFWLRRAKHLGWQLRCSEHAVAHAPEDGLTVSHETLLFEQYGEALWCASTHPSSRGAEGIRRPALDSLQNRIGELRDTRLALVRGGMLDADNHLVCTLTSVELALKRVLDDVAAGNRTSPFTKDLEIVLQYCGSE